MDLDLSGISDWWGSLSNDFLNFIYNALPDSPFSLLDSSPIAQYLPYINYFVPVDFIVDTAAAWAAAMLCYFGWSVMMRNHKVIS